MGSLEPLPLRDATPLPLIYNKKAFKHFVGLIIDLIHTISNKIKKTKIIENFFKIHQKTYNNSIQTKMNLAEEIFIRKEYKKPRNKMFLPKIDDVFYKLKFFKSLP